MIFQGVVFDMCQILMTVLNNLRDFRVGEIICI